MPVGEAHERVVVAARPARAHRDDRDAGERLDPGTTVEYPDTSGVVVATGRYFNEQEDLDGLELAVLGPDVADKLFPSLEPIGQEVR